MTKRVFKIIGIVVAVYILMLAVIYIDVVLRAKKAYYMGEKYFNWYLHPEIKQKVLTEERDKKLKELEENFKKGKIDKTDYENKKDLILTEYDWKINESSIKNAYMWYKTVVDLFQPPKSKYVKLSEDKMRKALKLWKKELKEKNIKFEEYMLKGE